MNKIFFSLCSLLLLSLFSFAQDDIEYDDVVYDQDIASVEFRLRGQFTRYPMMNLRGGSALTLSFDDFNDDIRYLNYKLILCNADWTPAEIEETDYLSGFNDNEIEESEFSFNTRAKFINYQVQIPNEDVHILQPGNYILYVYDTDNDFPVLTRRFLVLQERFSISAQVVAPSMVEFRNTHHEIDFEINTQGQNISNPDAQLKVHVLQNWRWDNKISNLAPRYSRGDILNYDYNNKILFEAGNEFRGLDIRSFDFLAPTMEHLDVFNDGYGVHLKGDPSRYSAPYLNYNDLDGDFIVQNIDEIRRTTRRDLETTSDNQLEAEQILQDNFEMDINDMRNNKLRSDYADIYFRLEMLQEIYDTDVYVIGQFSNWKLLEKNRMIYNAPLNQYEATVELKQGYYDYMYAAVPKGKTKIQLEELEGSHYETKNEYIVLVYHRGIGDRHDRLLGYRSIFSSEL